MENPYFEKMADFSVVVPVPTCGMQMWAGFGNRHSRIFPTSNVTGHVSAVQNSQDPGFLAHPQLTPSLQHQIYTLPCQTNFNRAVTTIVATNFEECCKTTVAVATMPTKQQQLQNNPRFRTHETHPERMVRRGHSANDRVMPATCGRAWLPQWAS